MFNWLPLSDRKNIDMPILLIEEFKGQPYAGYYLAGTNTVGIVETSDERQLAATLAHEFKHVTQWQLNQNLHNPTVIDTSIPYEKMIFSYFNNNLTEMEALLYEFKLAKSELNDWWLNHIVRCKNIDLLNFGY